MVTKARRVRRRSAGRRTGRLRDHCAVHLVRQRLCFGCVTLTLCTLCGIRAKLSHFLDWLYVTPSMRMTAKHNNVQAANCLCAGQSSTSRFFVRVQKFVLIS